MKTAKRPRGVGNLSKAPNPLSKAFPRCDHSPKVYPNSSRAQMGLSCRFTSHNQTDVLNFQSFHYLIVFPSFLSFHLFSIFFPSFFHLFSIFFPSFLSSSLFCRFRILPFSPFSFSTVIVRTSSLRPSAPHFFSASTPVSTASRCAPSRAHIPLFFPVSSFLHM